MSRNRALKCKADFHLQSARCPEQRALLQFSMLLPSCTHFDLAEATQKKGKEQTREYWICTWCLVLAVIPQGRQCEQKERRGVVCVHKAVLILLLFIFFNLPSHDLIDTFNTCPVMILCTDKWRNTVAAVFTAEYEMLWMIITGRKRGARFARSLFFRETNKSLESAPNWTKIRETGNQNCCDWQGDETVHSRALRWQYFNVAVWLEGERRWRGMLTAITWKGCCKVKSYTSNVLSSTHRDEKKKKRRRKGKETFLKRRDHAIVSDWQVLSLRVRFRRRGWKKHKGS